MKYRGIFINDEEPALGGWAKAEVRRLQPQVLRACLRADPAPARQLSLAGDVGQALQRRRPENARARRRDGHRHGHLAPRADDARAGRNGSVTARAPWDYAHNAERLRAVLARGASSASRAHESIVTVGMRGDGDMPMTAGHRDRAARADRRRPAQDHRGRHRPPRRRRRRRSGRSTRKCRTTTTRACGCPTTSRCCSPTTTGATSAACPQPGATRAGGFGIYYHFDYVGGPRNYKWINTNQIERVWEQMHLAYAYGARPALDRQRRRHQADGIPDSASSSTMRGTRRRCGLECLAGLSARLGGASSSATAHAAEIGELLTRYTQYNARRKPELLAPDTYSLDEFR